MRPGRYWWISRSSDGAVLPAGSEHSGVLELQRAFKDPTARVVQRCALLSSPDAHLDDFRAAPALRGDQGATRRFRPIAGSRWFGRGAPAADDEEARVEASPPGECAAVARAAPHVALAAMRAITHVVGNAIRSSRRDQSGAAC